MASLNFTNGTASVSPTVWFTALDPLMANKTGIWPWVYITHEQWSPLITYIASCYFSLFKGVTECNLFIYWIGIIGNILTVITICLLPLKSISAFYFTMLAIATFDLCFLVIKFTRYEVYQSNPGPIGLAFYQYASGIAYTFSLFSDMITLALTVERYLALAFPVFYKGLTNDTKRWSWFSAVIISLIISVTRMHYSFDNSLYQSATMASYTWFAAVIYFSDTVTPFVITGIMIILVIGIIRVVYKRSIKPNASIPKKDSDDALKTISLLAALTSMFLFNQFGYIMYTISYLIKAKKAVTYYSTLEEAESYAYALLFYYIAGTVSSPLEIASRSLLFYLYAGFNKSFRQDYIKGLQRIGLWKKTAIGIQKPAGQQDSGKNASNGTAKTFPDVN